MGDLIIHGILSCLILAVSIVLIGQGKDIYRTLGGDQLICMEVYEDAR